MCQSGDKSPPGGTGGEGPGISPGYPQRCLRQGNGQGGRFEASQKRFSVPKDEGHTIRYLQTFVS